MGLISRWTSFQDGLLFEVTFANSRGGLLFEMNDANIEIGFYKPIGLMKFFFDNFLYCKGTILKRRPWASFRDGLLFKITFTVWEFSYIPFMYVSLFIRNS